MPEPTRVALIDSGIDPRHPDVRGRGQVLPGAVFGPGGRSEGGGDRDLLGHGTAVAAAILDLAPGIELLPLRVFESDDRCDFACVVAALAAALEHAPAVVNLSLGTTSVEFRAPLLALIARAQERGIRIVAPATLGGLACDPGALPGVDAVLVDPNVPRALPVRRTHAGRSYWYASPQPATGSGRYPGLRLRGESLAAGYVTGLLARSRRG